MPCRRERVQRTAQSGWPWSINEGHGRAFTNLRFIEALLLDLLPFWDARVVRDLSAPETIVEQNFGPALFLNEVMALSRPPPDDGLFVPPTRQRQNPAFACETLVANIVDEPVDFLQLRPQHLGFAKVCVPQVGPRMDFEDYRKHPVLLKFCRQPRSRCRNGRARRVHSRKSVRANS